MTKKRGNEPIDGSGPVPTDPELSPAFIAPSDAGSNVVDDDAPEATVPTGEDSRKAVHLVRWVGTPVQYIRRRVGKKIIKSIDWDNEPNREAPTPGHSLRFVRPASFPGLSRSYQFGKRGPFVTEMLADDAAIVLADESVGHNFIDVTSDPKYAGVPIQRLTDPWDKAAARELKAMGRGLEPDHTAPES